MGCSTTSATAAKPKPVSVFPAPGTPVASDATTFSFRGLKPKNLGKVRVIGSKSGRHGYTRLHHSDGRGVSVVPNRRFTPGEEVRVFTRKRIKLTRNGDFRVRIGRFYGNDDKAAGPQVPVAATGLRSRPDLKPPVIDVATASPEVSPGMFMIAPRADGLMIADNLGRTVFFRPTSFSGTGEQLSNFQKQEYEGKPVLTYWRGATSIVGFGQIGTFEILNQRYNRIAKFEPGNGYKADLHEFELTPRDTALVLAYRGVLWKENGKKGSRDRKILDNIVQEVDIKTGAVLFEWHSLGNVNLKSSVRTKPAGKAPWDFFHLNSAKDDGDSLLISARGTNSVYRIGRDDARVKWSLRGDGRKPGTNSFKMGEGTSFGYQHDAQRLADGSIAIFDNGVQRDLPTVNPDSSALVLRLWRDGGKPTASLVARYNHPEQVVSGSQGNADPLDGGNWIVGWGDIKRFTEFTPTGEVAFDATFEDAGQNSYRAYKAPWQGYPPTRPAVLSKADGEGAQVWASWNGATRVHTWKVLTGKKNGSLVEVGSSPWQGLETRIRIPTVDSKVRIVAYDAEGQRIGQSLLVPLGQRSR